MLQACLRTYHPEDAGTLNPFFPEAVPGKNTVRELIDSIASLPYQIHYSWLTDMIGSDSLLLGSLPEALAKNIAKVPIVKLTKPLRIFFFRKLLIQIRADIVPKACLPSSPLNPLLDLRKRTLVRLIGFLGLRDLALSLRTIIDPNIIRSIRALLTESQKRYLDRCMREQDPLTKEIELSGWSGDQMQLARLLQIAGLKRVAKAMVAEDPGLQWYLSRHLDKPRGEFLIAQMKEGAPPHVSLRIRYQIADLMELFA